MARLDDHDSATMIATLMGIKGVEVLKFVHVEEDSAIARLIETPCQPTVCPTCGAGVKLTKPVELELPATTAGTNHVLVVWKRRRWRCTRPRCNQKVFVEQNEGLKEGVHVEKKSRHSRRGRLTFKHDALRLNQQPND